MDCSNSIWSNDNKVLWLNELEPGSICGKLTAVNPTLDPGSSDVSRIQPAFTAR